MQQDKFNSILKENALTVTKVRLAIYKALSSHNQPIGVNTLVSSLSGQADRASIYRNIEIFENIGVLDKVYSGWKYRLELSEKFRPHHHHMSCQKCGVIITIELGNEIEQSLSRAGKKHGFRVVDHEVELQGLCKNCR